MGGVGGASRSLQGHPFEAPHPADDQDHDSEEDEKEAEWKEIAVGPSGPCVMLAEERDGNQ